MLILVTYDVSTETAAGRKRLRHVAKICVSYGIRVQNSVFECHVDASQLVKLKSELLKAIDKDHDSVRLYNLGNRYDLKVEQYGTKQQEDPEGPLVI